MDPRVEKLKTPAECEIFAKNTAERKRPDLAAEARRKAVDMQASTHEAASPLEAEAFAAVYAYEALLTRKRGKKTRASGTWQAIKRHGIVEAVQRALSYPPEATDRETLHEMGLADFTFEALVLRHEASFSEEAVQLSKARLAEPAQH